MYEDTSLYISILYHFLLRSQCLLSLTIGPKFRFQRLICVKLFVVQWYCWDMSYMRNYFEAFSQSKSFRFSWTIFIASSPASVKLLELMLLRMAEWHNELDLSVPPLPSSVAPPGCLLGLGVWLISIQLCPKLHAQKCPVQSKIVKSRQCVQDLCR